MAFAHTASMPVSLAAQRSSLLPGVAPRLFSPAGRRHTCTVVAARNFKTRETQKDVNIEANKTAEDLQVKAQELVKQAQERWDKVEEKPAALAIGVTALIVIWAASGLVDRIDKLPLVGGLLELVGLLVTGWFIYRYLVFGPDREELKENIDSFLTKVTGKSTSIDKL